MISSPLAGSGGFHARFSCNGAPGTNSSPEGLDKGFTHCWIVVFKTAKDRDAYLVHPAHKAFVEFALPLIEEALVVDFVPQK